MKNIIEDLQASITKHLPEELGKNLKTLLEEAESNKIAIKEYEDSIRAFKEENDRLNKEVSKLRKVVALESGLIVKEEQLKEQERNYKVKEAELKAEQSELRAREMKEIVGLVFKSPVYRKTITNDMGGSYDSQGRYNDILGRPNSITETEE